MTDLNFPPDTWAALESARDASTTVLHRNAIDAVLEHRPKPILEDGMYERPGTLANDCSHVVHVRDGFVSAWIDGEGNLVSSRPLPDHASNWRRIHEVPDPDDLLAVRDIQNDIYHDGYVTLTYEATRNVLRVLRGEA